MARVWTITGQYLSADPVEKRIALTAVWDDSNEFGERFSFEQNIAFPDDAVERQAQRLKLLSAAQAARNRALTLAKSAQTVADAFAKVWNERGTAP